MSCLCEEITSALTAAVAILAPELVVVDLLEGVELGAICGLIADPTSIIDSLAAAQKVKARGGGHLRNQLPGAKPALTASLPRFTLLPAV